MPHCLHCDRWVSRDYLRVFAPDELEEDGKVRACPQCTAIRKRGGVRKARSRAKSSQVGEIE